MRPIIQSLLAEISPNWLSARRLQAERKQAPVRKAKVLDTHERQKRFQTPCYVPPKRDGGNIASNM